MFDREVLSSFAIFFNLPWEEQLSALVRWSMAYSIMQVLAEEGSMMEEVPCNASPEGTGMGPY